jgi:hypothetical protein
MRLRKMVLAKHSFEWPFIIRYFYEWNKRSFTGMIINLRKKLLKLEQWLLFHQCQYLCVWYEYISTNCVNAALLYLFDFRFSYMSTHAFLFSPIYLSFSL